MRNFFRGFGEMCSFFWAMLCFWCATRRLKRIVRLEKRLTTRLSHLAKRREQLTTYHNILTNKWNLRPRSDRKYQRWMEIVTRIIIAEYGFSPEAVAVLDDGTYRIFYMRGYRPEHAVFEIYGSPRRNKKPTLQEEKNGV